jgi:uncharacterized membrane protein
MNAKEPGKFLGVKSRWWNRRDRRIFTPKSWGWGYDVNFYEVARRLHLRR